MQRVVVVENIEAIGQQMVSNIALVVVQKWMVMAMPRYIDAENMYKEVWKRSTSPLNEWDTWGVLNVLDMVKTEDVAPVVHAHWIKEEDCTAVTDIPWSMCSACGSYSLKLPYCAFCGAKMDEEVETDE